MRYHHKEAEGLVLGILLVLEVVFSNVGKSSGYSKKKIELYAEGCTVRLWVKYGFDESNWMISGAHVKLYAALKLIFWGQDLALGHITFGSFLQPFSSRFQNCLQIVCKSCSWGVISS